MLPRPTLVLLLSVLLVIAPRIVSAQTQAEMNQQSRGDFKAADAQMGEIYEKIIQKFSTGPEANPVFVEKLCQAQRAWLAFRDAHVASIYPDAGSFTAGPMCVDLVRAQLTRSRIVQLRPWLDGIGPGDVCAGTRPSQP